jgi:hypothetical protein
MSTQCSIALRDEDNDHKQMVDAKKSRIASSPQEDRFLKFLGLCNLEMADFVRETAYVRDEPYTYQRVSNWFRRAPAKVPEEAMPDILKVAKRRGVTGVTLEWFNLGTGERPRLIEGAPVKVKGVEAILTGARTGYGAC